MREIMGVDHEELISTQGLNIFDIFSSFYIDPLPPGSAVVGALIHLLFF